MTHEEVTIPAPPRPVTSHARRRSWAERPVRVWTILSLLVAAAVVYFCFTQVSANIAERELIEKGIPVEALVTKVENNFVPGKPELNQRGLAVAVSYRVPGAEEDEIDVPGRLQPNEPGQIATGDKISIKVDPNDARRWTSKREVTSLAVAVLMGLALLPIALVLIGATFVARSRVLAVWRDGVEADAAVVDTHQSSIAPMSRVVRYVLTESGDPRVYSTFCPSNRAPQKGEHVLVIHAANNPGRAVLADLYL